MADGNNEVKSGELADQKPKFKTNKVNVMFRQTTSETEPSKDRDSASPGPAAAKPAPKSSLALSHGRFTLAAIREPSASSSSTPSPAPQAWQRPGEGLAAIAPGASSAGSQSTPADAAGPDAAATKNASQPPRSVELNEEELTAKGILLAGRFHSASDMHWEDEEDDWMPPPNPNGDTAKPPTATKPPAAAAKPAAPALKPAEPPSDSTPWSSNARRAGPPAARPLTETIKEMKEQKGHQRRPAAPAPMAHIPPRPVFAAPNARPGVDGLSRFRINKGDAPLPIPVGRGPPPLNPRDLVAGDAGHHPHHPHDFAHSRFEAPVDDVDFSMFAKRKPLATPHDPPKPAAAAATPPKPAAIPERLRLKSDSAAPVSHAPRAGSEPSGASESAAKAPSAEAPADSAGHAEAQAGDAKPAASTAPVAPAAPAAPRLSPQEKLKAEIEQQKEEMRALVAAAKAKREAEEKEEREKQERLARKREEMRREIEEKRARELEEKERARKARLAEREAQREKERQERQERQEQARKEREQEREKQREKEREREREKEREREQQRERERERERELAHPVHSAGDWAAAKKKAGGPIFSPAWSGKPVGAKTGGTSDAKYPESNSKDARFRDSREPWDARKATNRESGTNTTKQKDVQGPDAKDSSRKSADLSEADAKEGSSTDAQQPDSEAAKQSSPSSDAPKLLASDYRKSLPAKAEKRSDETSRASSESSRQRSPGPQESAAVAKGSATRVVNGSSAKASNARHDLPVSVAPHTRPKVAYFADEQLSSLSRRPIRVKLPTATASGRFDVQEMMLLESPRTSPAFLTTASKESGSRRQYREPLADRRPANVRMPGEAKAKPKNTRQPRGSSRPQPFTPKRQYQQQDRQQERSRSARTQRTQSPQPITQPQPEAESQAPSQPQPTEPQASSQPQPAAESSPAAQTQAIPQSQVAAQTSTKSQSEAQE